MIIGDRIYDDEKLNEALGGLLSPLQSMEIGNIRSYLSSEEGKCMGIEFELNNPEQLSAFLTSLAYFLGGMKFIRLNHVMSYLDGELDEEMDDSFMVCLKADTEALRPYIETALTVDLQTTDEQLEDGDYMVRLKDDGYIIRRVENHVGRNMIHIDEYIAKSNTVAMEMKYGEARKIPEMPSGC